MIAASSISAHAYSESVLSLLASCNATALSALSSHFPTQHSHTNRLRPILCALVHAFMQAFGFWSLDLRTISGQRQYVACTFALTMGVWVMLAATKGRFCISM